MTAYNRLNGVYCSEDPWLLNTVLREEWGFDGFVVTDWFANGSTAGSVAARLTLEMPGQGRFYGQALAEALESGEIDETDVDVLVDDLLLLMERTGVLDGVGGEPEKPLDRPEDRALNRRAAAAGSVLYRNDGVLPLDPSTLGSIAVIGPSAMHARVMGGGSANVRPYHDTPPLDALIDRFPDLDIRYARGADIDRTVPPIPRPLLDGVARIEFFEGWAFEGDVVAVTEQPNTRLLASARLPLGSSLNAGVRASRRRSSPRPRRPSLHPHRVRSCGSASERRNHHRRQRPRYRARRFLLRLRIDRDVGRHRPQSWRGRHRRDRVHQ